MIIELVNNESGIERITSKKIENTTYKKKNLISLLFNSIYSIIYVINDVTKTHTHDNIILFKLLLKLLNIKYFKLCIEYNTNCRRWKNWMK